MTLVRPMAKVGGSVSEVEKEYRGQNMTRGGYIPCINPDDLGDIIFRNRLIQVPGSGTGSCLWIFEANKLTIAHF